MDTTARKISMIAPDTSVSTVQPVWTELTPTPVDAQTAGRDSTAARTWMNVLTPTLARTTEPARIPRVDMNVSA